MSEENKQPQAIPEIKSKEAQSETDLNEIKKNERIERTYDIEGLLAGGAAGIVVGIIISFNFIFAMEIGMFLGLIIGTRFKRKNSTKPIK